MLRNLLLAAASLLLPLSLAAQDVSVRYQSQVIGSRGLPVANQTVAVCTQPAVTTTQPCSPLATLATSTSTTSGGANPLTTDSLGNFSFYAVPGKYTVQVYGPQVSGQFVQPDTILSCSPAGNCALTGQNQISVYSLNGQPVMDNNKYPCTAAGFNAAIAAVPAAGGKVDASACVGSVTLSAAVVFGAPNVPVELLLGQGTYSFSNSSGNGFQLNGSGVHLHGQSATATVITSTSAFTGDFIHAEPQSGQTIVNNIEVDHLRVDGTNCTGCKQINFLSTTDPSSVHDVTLLNWLGTVINVTTSSLPSAAIPQHVSFRNMNVGSLASSSLTANSVTITGNQIYFGPDFYIVNRAAASTTFSAVVVQPTATTQGDGRWNGFFNSSFQNYNGLGTPCILITSPTGSNTGSQGNVIGPDNTFENCNIGYKITGGDASHKGQANWAYANGFDPVTQNLFSCDFCQNNYFSEKTNGNPNDVVFTANSQGNTAMLRLAGSASDVSDSGTANAINSCINASGTSNCQFKGQLTANTFSSASASTSTSGVITLANGDAIGWRGSGAYNDFIFRNGDVLTDQINGTNHAVTEVIASGTTTLTSGAITAATCQTRNSSTATGALTTDAVEWAYATAPTLTTDALLHVSPDVSSAGNIGFTRCNPTAGSITGTAIVINWRVVR